MAGHPQAVHEAIDTLASLARTLDTEFAIDIHLYQCPPKLLSA